MITAESITDEQIRELKRVADNATNPFDTPNGHLWPEQVSLNCIYALSPTAGSAGLAARVVCAEILNARKAAR